MNPVEEKENFIRVLRNNDVPRVSLAMAADGYFMAELAWDSKLLEKVVPALLQASNVDGAKAIACNAFGHILGKLAGDDREFQLKAAHALERREEKVVGMLFELSRDNQPGVKTTADAALEKIAQLKNAKFAPNAASAESVADKLVQALEKKRSALSEARDEHALPQRDAKWRAALKKIGGLFSREKPAGKQADNGSANKQAR